nr:histidine--tRNA ligase, cytoplasmic [Tanacetum cinerariifolium]
GTCDFSKEQIAVREKALSIITNMFESHGAMALDTPRGELCSLRYDLTVPFPRYVAMNRITSFRGYQMEKSIEGTHRLKEDTIDEKGLNTETVEKIGSFVKLRGHPFELLLELKKEGSQGLDYYTGVIYEAITKGATQVGSIAGGGRHDDLIGTFHSKPFVAAIGVSLGIERVFAIMEQNQKDDKQIVRARETQVLVSIFGEDLSLAAKLVNKCWCANLKASFLVNKRVSKHFDRAKEFRFPWIVMLGEQETSRGVVTLKNKDT